MEIGGDVDVVTGRDGTRLQTIIVLLHYPEQGPLAGIAVPLQRRRQLKRAVADFGQKCSGGRVH